ncbi:MAG TPA: Yip1 family protein [Bacteroidales bacterium]|nr:Yip1 family protein [Bacteroidales bacterium]
MSNGTFDFNVFIKESKDVLVNPKSYFSTMKTSGGMAEPLIKAVIYGAIAGIIRIIWGLLRIGGLGGIFGGAIGVMGFIWSVIAAVIGLFIGAVILLVISSICKGSTDFEANTRVVAATMVIMPISALLGFTDGINVYLGGIISLAVNVFSLWLLYNGLVESLKSKPETTRIVMYVLIAFFVVMMLVGFGTRRRAAKFMQEFNNSDFTEQIKDIQTD